MITLKLCFSKTQKLRNPAEFQAVFKQSLRSRSPYFTILARANKMDKARLGLVVAKRVIRQAVHRNRIKRVIRESFRVHQHLLVGLDLVVLVRSELSEQNQVYDKCLKQQWKNLISQFEKG